MTTEDVLAARSSKRRPEEDRWNLDQMNEVTESPWEPAPGARRFEFNSGIGIRDGEYGRELEDTGVRESKSRRIYITKVEVQDHSRMQEVHRSEPWDAGSHAQRRVQEYNGGGDQGDEAREVQRDISENDGMVG